MKRFTDGRLVKNGFQMRFIRLEENGNQLCAVLSRSEAVAARSCRRHKGSESRCCENAKATMMRRIIMLAALIGLAAAAQAQIMNSNTDWHGLQSSGFQWQRGDLFKELCTGQITFTNTGTEAIGNIHYRTYYVSETGVVHENSIIDAVIEKLIQPGQTRQIELEKFLVPVDCQKVGMNIISCEVLPQLTTAPAAAPGPSFPAVMLVDKKEIEVQVRRSADQTPQAAPLPNSNFIVGIDQILNNHDFAAFANYAPARMNYFGHAGASKAWIARDMASDLRTYSWTKTSPDVETYSGWTDGQGLTHESMQEETWAQEAHGRMHHAHCLLTMVRAGKMIQSLELKVLPGKVAARN